MNTHILRKSLLALGGVFLSSISAQAQLQNGLLNYWPMEGDASDVAATTPGSASTTADDGTINGTVTFVDNAAAGLGAGFGMAGNFPGGAGNNITVLDPDDVTNDIDRSNADLTISAWFLLNNRDTGWQALIAHGEGSDYRVAVNGTTSPIPMSYAGGGAGSDINSTTTVGVGPAGDATWHHIVVTTEGSTTQLFLDGVLEILGGTGPINESGQNLLCIGCNPNNGREWNGLIDDVGMWDRALTTAEVTQIYDNGIAGNDLSNLLDSGDDDGLTDDVETNNGTFVDATNTGTNPRSPDSDGDGIDDGAEDGGNVYVNETQTGSAPNVADSDADTMPDGYEVDNGQDPNSDDGAFDPDLDNLDNLTEFGLATDPQDADTDGDGLEDGAETVTHETDPNHPDTDDDSLTDGAEVNEHLTNPKLADSDGDLFNDDFKIAQGSDPNDVHSTPNVPDLPVPLMYYSFDIEEGTVVENLGSLETEGNLVGGATYGDSLDPAYGTAFYGNRTGANDAYVQTGFAGTVLGFGPASVYTAMAWVKWDGASGNVDHMVFGQEDGPGNQNQLHHGIRADSTANVHYGGWGNDINDAGTVVEETWTHLAWQFDGSDKEVYVDGIETARGAGATMAGHAFDVIIGGHGRDAAEPAGQSFNGAIDEVKIYDEVLTEAQVRSAMLPGEGSGAAGLEIKSIDYDRENGTVTLTFSSRPGRSYALVWTADFQDGPNHLEIDDGINADTVENITSYTFPAPRSGGDPARPITAGKGPRYGAPPT